MLKYYYSIFLLFNSFLIKCSLQDALSEGKFITTKAYMVWPNATVPFFIYPDHFDTEQARIIMSCLAQIGFRTCVKFAPVMTAPTEGQHVMTFINPTGVRLCRINARMGGHSNFDPHYIVVGYECLKSPELEMIVLRALGLPFEHNRMTRDIYIDVLLENIEPSYVELFTKDGVQPLALRNIPYDRNSVMHFGERDYSKNGHRTIIFKNPSFQQNRNGISPADVKKIEIIYGPECRKRDRAEKVALCQSYPGVARRKREIIEPPVNRSLRVNPYITPPYDIYTLAEVTKNDEKLRATIKSPKQECSLKTLGIYTEADKIIDLVYQLSNLALKNAREKYCNISSNSSSEFDLHYEEAQSKSSKDILGVFKILADFANSIVDDAVRDLKEFCQNSESIEAYQSQCKGYNDTRCPKNFRASKSEAESITNNSEHVHEDHKIKKSDKKTTSASLKSNRRKREVTTIKSLEGIQEKVVQKEKNTQKNNTKEKLAQKEKNKDIVAEEATNEGNVSEKEKIKGQKALRGTEINNEGVTETNLKHKLKAIKKERLKEIEKHNNTTKKLEVLSSTTSTTVFKEKEDKNKILRKFREKRYKIQGREKSGEESDISIGTNSIIEPEKSLFNQDSVKKLLVKGLESVIKPLIIKKEETAESDQTEEETKEEIHIKADQITTEIDSDEVEDEEESEDKHKSKRKIPKTVKLSQLNKEFYKERKWPDGEIIYAIRKLPDYDLDDLRSRLQEVNHILKKRTCVKLREVDPEEAPGFEDALLLDNSTDYVTGRVGKLQNFGCIELFEGGLHKQHTAMMVMAMLGFYFEVSRHDRDKHIRVHNRHIRPDKLHHFEKLADEATLNITYDYKSATHPSYRYWIKIGKTNLATVATYRNLDPDGSIMHSLGENEELLSDSDILKINSVYGVDCFQPNIARNKEAAGKQQEEEEMAHQHHQAPAQVTLHRPTSRHLW